MAGRPLDALILEDCEDDALLVVRELGLQGFDVTWERAWTAPSMKSLLEARSWDVVLSDYSMPGFDAPAALRLLQESGQDLPFIVVSGTVGEGAAVAAMKNGAHDYLMKGNLTRLGAAIEREIRDVGIRREHRLAIDKVQHLNRVLRAIRNVSQLIVREKDAVRLIEGGCECLVETRGYDAAWIALLDEQKRTVAVAGRSYGTAWTDVCRSLEHGAMPLCALKALASSAVVFVDKHVAACNDCVIHQGLGFHKTLTVRIEHQERVYGVMTVTLLGGVPVDESETYLFEEVAGDLGFALWAIEVEAKRRRSKEALKESEEYLSKIIDAIGDPVFVKGDDFRFRLVNKALCTLLGKTKHELIGATGAEFLPPEEMDHFLSVDRAVLSSGIESICEERLTAHDGTVRTIVTKKTRYVDHRDAMFIVGVIRDMTEIKQMQAQLGQSDRLATMGMLAAGVAHEINNPLTYMLYNLESLTDELPTLSTALRKCLDIIVDRVGHDEWSRLMGKEQSLLNPVMIDDIRARFQDALLGAHRIRDVARGLGTFSRVEQDRLVSVALMHVIEASVNMAFNEIKYRARLVKEYGQTSTILANDGRLSQVFLNLLINAAHAIQEGDVNRNEIRVRTWQEGDEVFVEVRDTGKGIAKEHLPHLFEPFFTTKAIGDGTGLGLAISKNIVEEHGGHIEVKSEIGKGTQFVVRLPVRKAVEPTEPALGKGTPAKPDVRGRILIIDDEAGIRNAMVRMLGLHDVVQAASGKEARKILEADQAFDLILCDMMMPAMSGVELHAWLSATHPDLARQVVFITGGAFTPMTAKYLAQISNIRLEKPFDGPNFKKIVLELVLASKAKR